MGQPRFIPGCRGGRQRPPPNGAWTGHSNRGYRWPVLLSASLGQNHHGDGQERNAAQQHVMAPTGDQSNHLHSPEYLTMNRLGAWLPADCTIIGAKRYSGEPRLLLTNSEKDLFFNRLRCRVSNSHPAMKRCRVDYFLHHNGASDRGIPMDGWCRHGAPPHRLGPMQRR